MVACQQSQFGDQAAICLAGAQFVSPVVVGNAILAQNSSLSHYIHSLLVVTQKVMLWRVKR